jgi:Pyruvate/2-oxoacid:ferredoxin oxidoreductase delta subunit
VSVLSLERETDMPAQREEVLAAKEEGVRLFDGAALVSVRMNGMLKLHCVRGSFSQNIFTPAENSDFHLDADAIIAAIGQDPELEALRPLLGTEGFFAGGDAISRARFVSHAIGMGREAALEIDAWLAGSTPSRATAHKPVPLSAINTAYHPRRKSSDPATEAARCFSCGRCTLCDNCYQFCPDMAVRRVAGGYEIAPEYCKGCGLCVAECPTGSILMQEERK